MQAPLKITFREIDPSPAIEAKIRERATKLNRFFDRITSCNVVVEAPHRRHHQGRVYQLHIDLTVPDGELAVTRNHALDHAHEDVYVAIRDAFDAAQRQLEDYARRHRSEVKTHAEAAPARVARLFPEEGYGFIATADGREIYFHKNSVPSDGFAMLRVGSEVHVVETAGEKGPQATTVRAVGKSH